MWNWFKHKNKRHEVKNSVPVELSNVGIDMHSHLLPGIDDGAENMEQSIELILHLKELGYHAAVTTPHIFWDMYRNNSEIIRQKREEVNQELKKRNIDFRLEAAAEYYCDEHFENLIEADDLLCLGKKNILFEMGFAAENANLGRVIFNLQIAGYKPILAHPERYEYWHGSLGNYERMLDKDVALQLNITSLTGQYGPNVKRISEKLIDARMISYLGTDCHHMGHIQLTNAARTNPALRRLLESGDLRNLTLE
jgi:protein-tyrosine phosphatase